MINLFRQFLATYIKDLVIIWRDKAGMLLLFVMPMALVFIVCLVQNNVMQATGQSAFKVLLVDQDQSFLGAELKKLLADNGSIILIESIAGQKINENIARDEIEVGNYQFGIIIPEGLSQTFNEKFKRKKKNAQNSELEAVELLFDPTVQNSFRATIASALRYALLTIDVQHKAKAFASLFSLSLKDGANPLQQRFLLLEEQRAGRELKKPNATQQNVPAWALFGMFFIVVPLSATILRERREGTLQRLLSYPVANSIFVAGKIAAYSSVCMIQFTLMIAVGYWLLPLAGAPTLEIGSAPIAVLSLACAASLAATGYGIMLGTLVRTYDQASMFAPVSIVIAAAIGGIMVPSYVMPAAMQQLAIFSPLSWGLDGFVTLFVRGGGFADITANLLYLMLFFTLNLVVARIVFFWRYSRGTL